MTGSRSICRRQGARSFTATLKGVSSIILTAPRAWLPVARSIDGGPVNPLLLVSVGLALARAVGALGLVVASAFQDALTSQTTAGGVKG